MKYTVFSMIRTVSMTIAAVLGLAANVHAADASGGYLGLNLGYADFHNAGQGVSTADMSYPAQSVWDWTNRSQDQEKPFVGLKVGYNMQFGKIVHGVVLDWNYLNMSSREGALNYGSYSYYRQDAIKWLSTLRGKVGVEMGKVVPYVTAGLAAGKIQNTHQTITCCPTLYESNGDTVRYGWVAGLGTDINVASNFAITLEATYNHFSEYVGTTGGPNANKGHQSNEGIENSVIIADVGLDYRF